VIRLVSEYWVIFLLFVSESGFLSQGFSTPFLSLGSSYMYTSLKEAKQAVLAVGEEIKNAGLPLGICPLIFVFTGTGNVSQGAQEMFRLLPHMFVEPSELQSLVVPGASMSQTSDLQQRARGARVGKSQFQVYGTVVLSQHMVEPIDSSKQFHKADYYAHPDQYRSVFAKTIAPYASVIVNCMYWERRFPRLLTNDELRELHSKKMCRLLAVGDITCDIGGSIECVCEITAIESPFLRYDPEMGEIHKDMNGEGIIFLAVDCVPTELPKEATKHFGDVLYPFLSSMAHASSPEENLVPIQNACIAHNGKLRPLYEYIQRMRQSQVTMKEQQTAKMNGEKNGQLVRVVSSFYLHV
jgi:alpha-aminoadipic semialdehyde synthase